MSPLDKPLVWLHERIETPPFPASGRLEAGHLLRRLQQGDSLGMPHSRPMPIVGPRCHELRVRDAGADWRIVYRLDATVIVIIDVFSKKTRTVPKSIIDTCQRRLREYDGA
jgi:phage-related protein